MNLKKKKALAARTFNVGKGRISFMPERIDEIKEAITKQDMRDLKESGAIAILKIKGRLKSEPRKRRRAGKIKKTLNKRKENYILLTRKLREYAKQLKMQGKISKEKHTEARKQIKSSNFRSKQHFKSIMLEGKK